MDNIKFAKVPVGEMHNLLEPNIYDKLEEEQYSVLKCSPYELLSYRRFDIAFKALFLEMLNKNRAFGTRLYKAHISAFSLGQFKEPNNNEKNSLEKFIEEFINIYNTINERGFDANKSLIPLSNDNIIRNGAHRFASALEANKDIYCIKTEVKGPVYDYKFFYERNVSSQFLDIAATKFAEISLKTQIALVWPSAIGYDIEIEEYLGKVIYKKDVYLNMNGAHNLMSQVYAGEKWLGTLQNDFNGTKGKIVGCFRNNGPLRVILFESDSLDEVLIAKDNIRKIFNIGKHAIHITDRHDEVLKLSKILFNDNSIHFLNHAKPNKFLAFHKKLDTLSNFATINKISHEDIVIDSGMVMSLFGLRQCEDIDYIINKNCEVKNKINGINSHNHEIEFHGKSISDLIYDPQNYFYFNGFKFVSFNQLYIFKKNRAGAKDLNDLIVMEALLENDKSKILKGKIKQRIFYYKHKLKSFPIIITIKLLKGLGLYDKVRNNYHIYKKSR